MKAAESATDQAYNGIVDMIVTGNLRPGERTSINLLAERLNLGRTPIKEAITRLETEGVLTVAGRSGTTVRQVDADLTQQLFALRRTLEDFAAEEAVHHVLPSDIEKLKSILSELQVSSLEGSKSGKTAADFVRANVAFHAAIIDIARNSFLSRFYSQLQLQVQLIAYLSFRGPDQKVAKERQKEHENIVNALARRDAELLKQRLREHAEVTETTIINSLAAPHGSARVRAGSMA